jgi:hypothetical protein
MEKNPRSARLSMPGREGPFQLVGQGVLAVVVAADLGADPPPGGGADVRGDPQQRPHAPRRKCRTRRPARRCGPVPSRSSSPSGPGRTCARWAPRPSRGRSRRRRAGPPAGPAGSAGQAIPSRTRARTPRGQPGRPEQFPLPGTRNRWTAGQGAWQTGPATRLPMNDGLSNPVPTSESCFISGTAGIHHATAINMRPVRYPSRKPDTRSHNSGNLRAVGQTLGDVVTVTSSLAAVHLPAAGKIISRVCVHADQWAAISIRAYSFLVMSEGSTPNEGGYRSARSRISE